MAAAQQDLEYKDIDLKLVKRLLKFLKPYMKYVWFAIAFTILVSALGPLRPYLTKLAIDDYIAMKDWNGLLKMIVYIFALMLFHGFLQFSLTYLMQWVGQHVLLDIRLKLFSHIQSLSLRFFDKNPVGRLVTRVTNDIEVLNEMFSSGVVMILADILLLAWIVVFMFITNVNLTLLTLSILPLLIIVTSLFRKKVRVVFRNIRLNVSSMNSFLNEFISGIQTVKLFQQESAQKGKFDELNLENRRLWIRSVFYYASFFPVVEFLSSLALGLILWYTAGNILSGMMTVGTLIAFLQYSEMFFRPVRDLTEKYTTLQSAMASSERIFDLLDDNSVIPEDDSPEKIEHFENSIKFENVCFSYDGSKEVLKNLSFEVQKGQTVAIVGATGAGKTSIIGLLCRFYDFQKGNILIDGKSIRNLSVKSLREKIALVMQDVFLFSGTIADNISLRNPLISESDIQNALMALGAENLINKSENGIHAKLTERGSTLSTGQRQLISFARAYVAGADLLILDEATSNIDSETEAIIENSLNILLKGRTSIIIAHRLSTIRKADKIIVLHHGEIRESGTHKELLEQNGIYSRLYKLQFSE